MNKIPDGWIKQPDGSYSPPARIKRPAGGSDTKQKEPALRSQAREAPNRQKGGGAGKGNRKRYSVLVEIGVPDNRKRDGDGMLATVLDCLINARGRLLAGYTGSDSESAPSGHSNT